MLALCSVPVLFILTIILFCVCSPHKKTKNKNSDLAYNEVKWYSRENVLPILEPNNETQLAT